MKSPAKIGENRFLGTISSSSIRNLLPKSISAKQKPNPVSKSKTFRSNNENAPPVDPNIQSNHQDVMQFTKQSSPKSLTSKSRLSQSDSHDEDLATSKQCIQVQKMGRDTCIEEMETPDSQLKVEDKIAHASGRTNTNTVLYEISEEDEPLGDQIRQLKEELIRTKSNGHKLDGSRSGCFARDSLNQLRASINRSLVLSCENKDDPEEQEMDVDDCDVSELNKHIETFHSSADGNFRDSVQSSFATASCEADTMSEDDICSEEIEIEEGDLVKHEHEHHKGIAYVDADSSKLVPAADISSSGKGISISVSHPAPILEEPTFSESPKFRNSRKSMALSTTFRPSLKNASEGSNIGTMKESEQIGPSVKLCKKASGPTESLAASLQRGLQIIDHHQRSSISNRSSVSFSFEHLALKPCAEAYNPYDSVQISKKDKAPEDGLSTLPVCPSCQQKLDQGAEGGDDAKGEASMKEKHLKNMCMEQATKIEQLTRLLDQYKNKREHELVPVEDQAEVVKETYDTKHVNDESGKTHFNLGEKEALLKEIADLKSKLQPSKSTENLRSSLLLRSIQLQKSVDSRDKPGEEELEKERERWTEMESEWISLTDELRQDIENQRRRAEELEMELKQEKNSTEELNDALHRAVLGHTRFIEEYTELQEKYDELAEKHRVVMIGVADMRKAAAKAGAKGRHGKRFAKAFVTELSASKAEKERERELLKKENKSLKAQLRDTAEAVQAAGELLVRLREAEQAASASEERFSVVQEENEKLKKQMEKLKSKHKTEMDTMKQYLAESRLPGSALQPWYKEEQFVAGHRTSVQYDEYDDDQAWRAEFGAIYQDPHF